MTEQEQIEFVAAAHDSAGPDWAKDEMELRQRAVNVVDHAFRDFDGSTHPVEVIQLSCVHYRVGENDTMPTSPTAFQGAKRIKLWPGLAREEAILVAEEWLRS